MFCASTRRVCCVKLLFLSFGRFQYQNKQDRISHGVSIEKSVIDSFTLYLVGSYISRKKFSIFIQGRISRRSLTANQTSVKIDINVFER